MSKEIFLYSEDKKYKCGIELAESTDRFGCPDHSMIVLFEEREDGTYIIAEARDMLLETQKDQQIAELQKQLEEKEKDNQFLKKMYLSERIKNDNYHTKKYGLDKPVEELRKIKLNPKEKEIYYKGFDNCERQFSTHIAELQQQLKSQPAEIVEEIKQTVKNNLVYPDNRIDCPFNDGYLDEETLCSIMDKVLQEYQKGEN